MLDEDLYSLQSVQRMTDVADVVMHCKLRWFKHLVHKNWVSICRNGEMAGVE